MILSVLEAVFGSSHARPTYAKARAPKTPAMEKAEVVVNTWVAVMSAMAVVLASLLRWWSPLVWRGWMYADYCFELWSDVRTATC